MSVIVREPDGRIALYCKGADSVIYERLTSDESDQYKGKAVACVIIFFGSSVTKSKVQFLWEICWQRGRLVKAPCL